MQNRELALVLFKKLFRELPSQIKQLEISLTTEELNQTQAIIHKLHGSVSFCGFLELQKLSHNLETSLLNADLPKAKSIFLQLKQNITCLQNLQDKIFQHLEKLT